MRDEGRLDPRFLATGVCNRGADVGFASTQMICRWICAGLLQDSAILSDELSGELEITALPDADRNVPGSDSDRIELNAARGVESSGFHCRHDFAGIELRSANNHPPPPRICTIRRELSLEMVRIVDRYTIDTLSLGQEIIP